MPVVDCPDCIRGTVSDVMGRQWRCATCRGTGRIITTQQEAPVTLEVIQPDTGELVDLRALPTTEIASALASLARVESEWKRFKRAAADELAARLDHEGRRSADVGEFHVEVNAPTEKRWDTGKLHETLDWLVERDLLSAEKAARCFRIKEEVAWSEVKTLIADPRVAEDVERCFHEEPATRTVRIK